MFDKKEDKKEEVKKEEQKKGDVKHLRTEGRDTHHDLLPEVPVEKVVDPKSRATTIEAGVETEVKKDDQKD